MPRLLLFLSLPLYVLDQWSKSWIADHLMLNAELQEVIPGIFWLHHAANTGVAFGLFNGTAYANYAFGAISLTALAFLTFAYRKNFFPGLVGRLAVALLVAGIFGNLTDRIFRAKATGKLFDGPLMDGYVVDFLRFDFGFWPFHPWPSFNVADSCVVVAAVCLAFMSFFIEDGSKPGSYPSSV